MKRKHRGSLTVEASISFIAFIAMMFLLLNLVKMVLFSIILNNTAMETAKSIATLGYPIAFLNEGQSGIERKEEYLTVEKLSDMTTAGMQGSVFTNLLGGDPRELAKSGAVSYIKNSLMGGAVAIMKGTAYSLKGRAVKGIAGWLIQGSLEHTGFAFQPEDINLRIVKIPVTEAEFKAIYSAPIPLSKNEKIKASPASTYNGMDGDFNAEDVVICLEYPVRMHLPFFSDVCVTLRSSAVEHAWLNGTCNGPKRTEGINLNGLLFGNEPTVYVPTGGYGTHYHAKGCMQLWVNAATPMTRSAAQADGFLPCKTCRPDDDKKK